MEDKEFMEAVHMEVHAMRRIPNYKSSPSEKNISRLVRETFTSCKECQGVTEQLRNYKPQEGFFKKLGNVINES